MSDQILGSNEQRGAIFRPRTISDLSVLLMTIMQRSPNSGGRSADNAPFITDPNPSQARLLRWVRFTSWAWQAWSAEPYHFEIIAFTVSLWTASEKLPHRNILEDGIMASRHLVFFRRYYTAKQALMAKPSQRIASARPPISPACHECSSAR